MLRFIIILCLLLISLLAVYCPPVGSLWIGSVIVQSYPLIFVIIVLLLLCTGGFKGKYGLPNSIACALALVLYCSPLIRGYSVANRLNRSLDQSLTPPDSPRMIGFSGNPIQWSQLFTFSTPAIASRTLTYDTTARTPLTLDLYPAQRPGLRPCVVVIHGSSWPGGDSRQLPALNSRLAAEGYVVAAINYQPGRRYQNPDDVQDVATAIGFLRRHAAELSIDSNAFVLLGRSEGAQIALMAAYTLPDPGLKGVIDYYGPTDKVRGFVNTSSIPTLIIHGQQDIQVPYIQSRRLSRKLADSGIRHYLLTLPWAPHSFDYTLNGPGGQLSTYVVERFLQEVAP
ncbi:MAG TPA: alpha/beta hydrolase [Puia sp.]|jgi:acetyl esterase/lipase|nr:alpha/beta hydrolase [Puia sp.]